MKLALCLPTFVSLFVCLASDVCADLERRPIRRDLLGGILAASPLNIDLGTGISVKIGGSSDDEVPEKEGGQISSVTSYLTNVGQGVKDKDRIYNLNAEDCNVDGADCNTQYGDLTDSANAGQGGKDKDQIYKVNDEDCNVDGAECNTQFDDLTESANAGQEAKGNDQIYKTNAEECDVDGAECNTQYGDVTETDNEAGQ